MNETDVEGLAALLGLPIEPESRAAVVEILTGLLTAARKLAELPLPDDTEPAPIFRP
jgi:1-carboxybiuret hydrolase subunit AtzG-like protein